MQPLKSIEFVEVGPRDGLQNEARLVSVSDKLAFITKAIDAGARRIEVASFANPRRVPQMADAEEVCAGLPMRSDVTFIGLVMNERGGDRAIATRRIDQLGLVVVATDQFALANQGQTSADSVAMAQAIIKKANAIDLTAQATIAASFGCPFEGEVAEDRVIEIAKKLSDTWPAEISLADTIGVANPAHVSRLVGKVKDAIAPIPVRVHFHNTRGTGLANVWAAIEAGAAVIDGAIGGLGGCPFAPGSAGNVASEDVVYMLERAGVQTGMDLEKLVAVSSWLGGLMEKKLPGLVAKAPVFPPVLPTAA
jgi:hydroxymethylglutaryl-CoA lyase